jgi:hypothetical protein
MPLEIKRIADRVTLTSKEVEALVKDYVAQQTGRYVSQVEFHHGRNCDLGAATVYLEFKD